MMILFILNINNELKSTPVTWLSNNNCVGHCKS